MIRTIGEPTPTRKYRVKATLEERFEFVVDAASEDLAEDLARQQATPGSGKDRSVFCHAELIEQSG